jgi:hypothetical protein
MYIGGFPYLFMGEIKFYLEKPAAVKIRIRNQYGRVVEIIDRELPGGEQSVLWTPKTAALGNVFRYEIEVEGKKKEDGIMTARVNTNEKPN